MVSSLKPLRILYIEPFNSGSHAQFTQTLTNGIQAEWTVLTLPGRHWKWRARGSAIYLVRTYPDLFRREYDLLFAGSFLPLTDLIALQPQLAAIPRVLYFHENQLAYPVREEQPRDHHFGFSQMVSALVATHCVFNSQWNLESFLESGTRLLKRMPDAIPPHWMTSIESRSTVLPLPMRFPDLPSDRFSEPAPESRAKGPIILWNHRWEHDKQPDVFFELIEALYSRNIPFRLAVCGESFRKVPPAFERAQERFADHIVHWGYGTAATYAELLGQAHIAVSTAAHEFFGIAMLEALYGGAYPLVPNRLAYPEHFPEVYRYEDENQALALLETLCTEWTAGERCLREDRTELTSHLSEQTLRRYESFFRSCIEG